MRRKESGALAALQNLCGSASFSCDCDQKKLPPVGAEIADTAKKQLDLIIHPTLPANCNRTFCVSAYPLCYEYDIYAIDAMYLRTALDNRAVLVSLDKEDFILKVTSKRPSVEPYHVSEFPY